MSIARKVEMNYDLKALSEAARDLGFFTKNNAGARGWYGVMTGAENCDLVITNPQHRFDMGFVRKDGKVEMFADFHGGLVQRDMAEKIIPRYLEKASGRTHRITERQTTAQQVMLTLERR